MLRQIGAELGAHWSTLIDQFHRATGTMAAGGTVLSVDQ
jgi:hypothetical protein